MRRSHAPVLLAALAASSLAHGAGFGIYEWSPSFNATGGTILGKPVDAATAFINPAAMTELPGTQVSLGATGILRYSTTQIGIVENKLKHQSFLIPGIHATSQLNEMFWLGFGSSAEFGMGTKYEKGWRGNWSNIETDLLTYTVAPTLGVKVLDNLSLAAGPRIMYVDFMHRNNKIGAAYGGAYLPLTIQGDSIGYGGIASLLWKITDEIGFGLVYRSQVKQTVEGTARSVVPGYYGTAKGSITFPASTTAGLNWQATSDLNLGVSVTFTEWSSYDELCIKVNGIPNADEKKWDDVWRFGAGAQYKLTDTITVLGGYVFDQDPINSKHIDYMLPPGDRHMLNTGLSFALGKNLDFSIGYTYMFMQTQFQMVRDSIPTKFKDSDAHLISSGLAYRF